MGCRAKDAAEIKPVEPVWVIPAKGAALSATITSVSTATKRPRVVIIGAGVVGLGIAWRLASRAEVLLFDRGKAGAGREPCGGRHARGLREAEPGEEALVALGRDSQARWPAFAEELLRETGIDVELRREGTLVLALTADDQATAFASSGISAKARPADRMALRGGDARQGAASGRQDRGLRVQPAGSSGRQPQA